MKQVLVLFSSALAVFGAVAGSSAPAGGEGWAKRAYLDPAFVDFAYATNVVKTQVRLNGWSEFDRWNDARKRAGLPVRKCQMGMSSFVFRGRVKVPAAGRYRFRYTAVPPKDERMKNSAHFLAVNGRHVREFPDGFDLKVGEEVRLELFFRANGRYAQPITNGDVEWTTDGTWTKVEKVTWTAADCDADANRLDHRFVWGEGRDRYPGYRTWDWTAPEDGLYEIVVNVPFGSWRFWVDDLQVASVNELRGVEAGTTGPVDTTGNRQLEPYDFFGCRVFTRFLKKGRHVFDFRYTPWAKETMEHAFENRVRLGVRRPAGLNPEAETGFWLEGRDAMVFEKDEKVPLRCQSGATAKRAYTIEFLRPNREPVVASKPIAVADGKPTFVDLKTDEEGAFDYRVKNAAGEIIEGPWQYVVVEVKRKKEKVKSADAPSLVVDCVTCDEGPGGAHEFRDSGTSEVVQSKVGAYRLPGYRDFKTWQGKYRGYSDPDWFAYSLGVKHPGRTHVVRVTAPNDKFRVVSVVGYDRKTGYYNAGNLEAGCGPACATTATMGFYMWPTTDRIDVMVYNSGGSKHDQRDRRGAVLKIELIEYPEGLPAMLPPEEGWTAKRNGFEGEQVNLGVVEKTMPDNEVQKGWIPANGWDLKKIGWEAPYRTWGDLYTAWSRWGEVCEHLGITFCEFPIMSYGMQEYQGVASLLYFPGSDIYERGLGEAVNPVMRDVFLLMLMEANKHGVKLVADPAYKGISEEMIRVWAVDAGCPTEGMLLTKNAAGEVGHNFNGATYPNPCHPAVRARLCRYLKELGRRYGKYPAFAGVRTRLWLSWPSSTDGFWGKDDFGYDDYTVGRFVKDTGVPVETTVGTNEAAFAARKLSLKENFAKEWYGWRNDQSLSLRREMLAALRTYAPQADLVNGEKLAKFDEFPGCGFTSESAAAHPELGFLTGHVSTASDPGVEWNGCELMQFRNFNVRPAPYTNVTLVASEVKKLSGKWRGPNLYPQGVCCLGNYRAHPYQLEAAAKALAKNDLTRLSTGLAWCLPLEDEGVRAFVRTWRSIPELKYVNMPLAGGEESAIAAWVARDGRDRGETVMFLVNRTDRARHCRVKLENASWEVDVPPFMPAWKRFPKGGKPLAVDFPLAQDEVDEIVAKIDFIDKRASRAKGISYVRPAATCFEKDVVETLDESLSAVRKARDEKRWSDLRLEMTRYLADPRADFWYEVIGWPAERCTRRDVGCRRSRNNWPVAFDIRDKSWEKKIKHFVVDPAQVEETELPGYTKDEPFTRVKGGRFDVNVPITGWMTLALQGVFGGKYGSVKVSYDGEVLGTIAVDDAEPRFQTRTLPVPFFRSDWPREEKHLTLESEGEMMILRIDLPRLAPIPVREWYVSRPFDKGGNAYDIAAFDKPFAPESGKVDFADGSWTKVTVPDGERVLDLWTATGLKKCAANESKVVYLAFPFDMPRRNFSLRIQTLCGYFGRMWVNGKVVREKLRGPDEVWGEDWQTGYYVKTDQGRNVLVVKVAPSHALDWRFGLQYYNVFRDELQRPSWK